MTKKSKLEVCAEKALKRLWKIHWAEGWPHLALAIRDLEKGLGKK